MNKVVTSKEDILAVSKEMVAENGVQAINMRNVARQCGVAVGSVYNYFPSKNDLMIAVIDGKLFRGFRTAVLPAIFRKM